MGQCRFTQTRRAVKKDMFEGLAPLSGSLDGDSQLLADILLPDALLQPLRPQGIVELILPLAL